MQFMRTTVVSSRDGDDEIRCARARVAVCECGSDMFKAFQIEGQNHLHLQCAAPACSVSYCPAGGCR